MAEGGLADALKPGREGLSLADAGNLVRDFQHDLPSGRFRGSSYRSLPSLGATPSTGRSYLGEFGDSFLHTVSEQNPTMFGQALETMGILMESDTLFDWGVDLQEFAVRNSMGQPGSVPSWSNVVDAEGVGEFLDSAARYTAAGLGTALGSMAPQVATGLAGAAAGAAAGPVGAIPGAIAGSLMPSVAMNMGEAYGTFVEEGVDRYRAAEWAAAITPFTAGLDALGFTKLITKGADTSGPLLRYIGRRIAQGYLSEATTEGAQAAIKEATAAHLTDNPDLAGRATKVLDEFLIGGMGGAAIAGPSAVMRGRQPRQPPTTETPEMETGDGGGTTDFGDLPTETPEMETEAPAAAPVEPMGEPAPAAETFTVELPDTIVKRDGKPYPSLKAVQTAKRNRNLAEHEPVEVEGGWALQRLGAAQEVLDEVQEAPAPPPPTQEVTELPDPAAAVEAAAAETNTEPTEAQKESGNYKKGAVRLHGLDLAIENPKGSTRSGTAQDGTEWSVEMPANYGYVKRTEGADGDQVDVYIGPEPDADTVYVVDQVDAESKAFDEHKAMLGYRSEEAALADYDAAFDDGRGPDRRGAVTAMSANDFKAWLKDGDTTKPVAAPQPEEVPDGGQADTVQADGQVDAAEQAPASADSQQGEAAPESEAGTRADQAVQDEAVAPADEPAARAPEAPPEPAAEPAPQREPADDAPLEPEPADAPVVEDVEPASEPPAAIRKVNGDPYPSLKAAEAAKRGPRIERMGGVREDYEAVRVQGGYELRHRDAETAVEEEVEPAPAPEPAPERRQVGTNREGLPVFEDERGVRSVSRNGIRETESVRLTPKRDGPGMTASVDPARRSDMFKTIEELEPEPAPAPEPEPAPAQESAGEAMDRGDLPAAIDAMNRIPTADGSPRVSIINLSEPAAPQEPTGARGEGERAEAGGAAPPSAPPARRRRGSKALAMNDGDKAQASELAAMFEEDLDDGPVRLSVRGPGRIKPISDKAKLSAMSFGRRLMELGATDYQDWSDALLDAMDDAKEGLGDRVAPYTRMIYESMRWDPANDWAALMTPPEKIGVATDGDTERLPDDTAGPSPDGRPDDAGPPAEDGGAGGVPGDTDRRGEAAAEDTAPEPDGEPGPAADQEGAGDRDPAGVSEPEPEPAARPERDDGPGAGSVGVNVRLTEADLLLEGRTLKQKARDNLAALELLARIETAGRPATSEEQAVLARYTGWGGLKGMFPDVRGKYGKGFEDLGAKLRGMLTDADYDTAQRSIQFAHYTSADVIRFMWAAMEKMGFKGGSVIEPGMGVGHFAGLMPGSIASNPQTSYFGLERDHVTARIAKQLYPTYDTVQADYTRRKVPRNHFAAAIGNPPFSANAILADPEYAANRFLLHDYFFAKTLDAVQPGGLLAFVTSAGTMNKIDQGARQYLADRANLVAAVRLPGGSKGAFAQSSNTQVTTDIIFLRKLRPGEKPKDQSWVGTENVEYPLKDDKVQAVSVSKYFRDNPQMVLGREGLLDPLIPGRYGVQPKPGDPPLVDQLTQILAGLPRRQWRAEAQIAEAEAATVELTEARKEGSFFEQDGNLFAVSRGQGVEVVQRGKAKGADTRLGFTLTKAEMERVKGLVKVRDGIADVMFANVARDEAMAVPAREKLHEAYDAFVAEHGPINKKVVRKQRYSAIEQESLRDQEREAARQSGDLWREGSFDPPPSFFELGMSDRAKERQRQREAYEARQAEEVAAADPGQAIYIAPFDEGSFNPADLGMKEIASYPNLKGFDTDPKYFVVAAIEDIDDDTEEISKGAIFERNVLAPVVEPDVKTVHDAVAIIMGRHGRFDLDLLSEVYGKPREQTIKELGDFIFELPGMPGNYVEGGEYLSGDVKTKLYSAAKAADEDPRYERNVKALEAVIPKDALPSEIGMSPGASWMPVEVKAAFAAHLGLDRPEVIFNDVSRITKLKGDPTAAAQTQWGSRRMSPDKLLSLLFNSKPPPKHFDTHSDGSKTLNYEDTTESAEKYSAIKDEWPAFLDLNPDLVDIAGIAYNDIVNRFVPRTYSGEWVQTPGIADGFNLRDYQKRVIARIIQTGNTYMAHAVGAGKTSAMIASAMEMRRLGIARKPMFVVPNPMLRQFSLEFLHQYPNANIAVADEQFKPHRRKKFVSSVALDDSLDAIIITHDNFKQISISPEFMNGIMQEEITALREVLKQLDDEDAPLWQRNQVEAQIDKLEQQLAKIAAGGDDVISFEETGADFLFVDEAHNYRKRGLTTTQNIKGIATDASQRALDLYYKMRYLKDMNGNRTAVFASGTPVENTLGEAYNISRYLQDDQLKALGIHNFDEWAANFATTKTEYELDAAGGYNPVTRFAQIVNLAELQKLLGQIADHVSPQQLAANVVRPQIGARGKPGRTIISVPSSEAQMAFKDELEDRMVAIKDRTGPPEKGDDGHLVVINDGRKAAIDMRLVDPKAPNDPESKLNRMIANIFEIYQQSGDQPFYKVRADGKGYEDTPFQTGPATQIAFMSLGLGDTTASQHSMMAMEGAVAEESNGATFNAKDWVVAELRRMGVPRQEIAFINDFKSNNDKRRLFNDMNDGKVRILIGHPKTLGTGVNVQSRLLSIHNLDALWFPSTDEQRVGRIERQGNMNPEVGVYDYATEGTYDASMWQIMKTKGTFIHDIWKQTGDREIEDMAVDHMEAMRDAASGDPRLLRRSQLEKRARDLEKERRLVRGRQEAARMQSGRLFATIDRLRPVIERVEAAVANMTDFSGKNFEFHVVFADPSKNVTLKDRKKAVEQLQAGLEVGQLVERKIAELGGIGIKAAPVGFALDIEGARSVIPASTNRDSASAVTMGTLQSISANIRALPDRLQQMKDEVVNAERQLAGLRETPGGTFPQEKIDEIAAAKEEVNRIDAEISAEREARREARIQARRAARGPATTASARPRATDARGMTPDAVHKVVSPIASQWGGLAPRVEIVRNYAALPPHVQKAVGDMWEGDTSDIRGLRYDAKDNRQPVIYMLADNLTTPAEVRRVLAHEVVGHYSLQEMLGDEFKTLLGDVARLSNAGDRQINRYVDRVTENYGRLEPDLMAEEVLAHMAEDGIKHPIMVRAIATIRRFLRSLGLRIPFSYAEVQNMIVQADRRLRGHRPAEAMAQPEERALRDATHTTRYPDAYERYSAPTAQHRQFVDAVRASVRPQEGVRRAYQPIDKLFRLPFAAVGGLDARGDWKWSKPVLDKAKKVVLDMKPDREGAFGWLAPMIDKARNGLIDRYGTPHEFVTRERQAHTERHLMMADLAGHLQALSDAEVTDTDAVALQEILEGKELNNERLAALAGPIREAIDNMGQELVDLGLLSADSYLQNLGQYLHRSYRKYEADAPALVRWKRNADKRRRQALRGDELMRRGRLHNVASPARLMRDVPKDMQSAVLDARQWEVWDRKAPSGKVTKRIYWPASTPRANDAFGPGVWESQGVWTRRAGKGGKVVLARDWTKAEREHMGEIRDARYNIIKSYELMAHDIVQGRMFRDIARNREWFSKKRPDLGEVIEGGDARYLDTFAGIDWVKVPETMIPKSNTARWGQLAGGYLRAPIYRDLMELQKMQRPSVWGEVLRFWKKSKTVHSPVVHFNNVMSNVFLADMIDVTFGDMARAIQEYAGDGHYFQEAQAEGVFSSGYAMMELEKGERTKLMNEILGKVEEENHGTAMQRMIALFKAFDDRMTSTYRLEDEIFRLASYIKDRNRGCPPNVAAQHAIDAFLNYDIRAPWVNAMRRSLLPFLSYTYRIVPTLLENMARKPWKLAKYFTMGYALQALSYELVEGDEEEEQRAMAPRDKGLTWTLLPKMLRLPFADSHGDPFYVNMTRIVPGGGLLDTDKGQLPIPEWMLVSGPIAIASDLLSNRVAFTGQDIVNRDIDTASEAFGKRLGYVARAVLPNAPWIPGSWSVDRIMRALGDERDFRGRQYSEAQAIVRSFGPKISTFDVDNEKLMRAFEFRRQDRAYQERLYKLRMDYGRGRMSEANFRKSVEQVFDGLRRVQEKRAAVFGGADG